MFPLRTRLACRQEADRDGESGRRGGGEAAGDRGRALGREKLQGQPSFWGLTRPEGEREEVSMSPQSKIFS